MSSNTRRPRRLNKPHIQILPGGRVNIPLTKGRYATIDAGDLRLVIKHSWSFHPGGGNRQMEYAESNIRIDGSWKRILLHRFIMQVTHGQIIDHRDGNGLNNTRENLRLANRNQNQHNAGSRGGKSNFKGVSWHKGASKWVAQICVGSKRQYLGLFKTEEEAARAYDAKAKETHGEFAYFNFPGEHHV